MRPAKAAETQNLEKKSSAPSTLMRRVPNEPPNSAFDQRRCLTDTGTAFRSNAIILDEARPVRHMDECHRYSFGTAQAI
jgi:hypothetical protein